MTIGRDGVRAAQRGARTARGLRRVDRANYVPTAREPVTLEQLLAWTCQYWARQGWDPSAVDAMAVKDVLGDWREFLNEEVVSGKRRYRVYHASFQDFLADEVGLVAYHATIGDSALAKIPGF